MKNIKPAIISLILFISLICLSCGSFDDGIIGSEDREFGYNSKYTGAAYYTNFHSYERSAAIAKEMIEAINIGNKIYNNGINAILPELISDNGTNRYITEEGYCKLDNGTREYKVTPIETLSDNHTLKDYITYNKYCLQNPLHPQKAEVTIENKGYLEENYKKDLSFIEKLFDFTSDNLSIKIHTGNKWDNITMNGLILKNTTTPLTQDNATKSSVQLSMDMPSKETDFRFDIYVTEEPYPRSKRIRFFHHEYGYVYADISHIDKDDIKDTDKITIEFNDNKTCTFSREELNSSDFNCGAY